MPLFRLQRNGPVQNDVVTLLLSKTEALTGCRGILLKFLSWSQQQKANRRNDCKHLTKNIFHCQASKGEKQLVPPTRSTLKTSQGKAVKALLLVAKLGTSREKDGNPIAKLTKGTGRSLRLCLSSLLAAKFMVSREKGC